METFSVFYEEGTESSSGIEESILQLFFIMSPHEAKFILFKLLYCYSFRCCTETDGLEAMLMSVLFVLKRSLFGCVVGPHFIGESLITTKILFFYVQM
jgi:hypothetical protein